MCLAWSLGAILKHLRRLDVRLLAKPVPVLAVDSDVLAEILVWRLWQNVLLVESHISVRIRHPVLDRGGLVIT